MEPANDLAKAETLKKVMVFCDGTWCGPLTGTETNVKILADAIAGRTVNARERFVKGGIVGCYYDGEGVQGEFSDYLLDGALGGRIRKDCLRVYKFLMKEFEETKGECEAWLIGLSRGAYTVRCVAGMINNCGLISKKSIAKKLGATPTKEEMKDIIQRGYAYYRDRTTTYLPNSKYMQQWKRHHSLETQRPPVKFMGLFETVGALGIPSLNPGLGVDYLGSLNFFGKADEGASAVSGEVERVYQSLAVHDRLTAFSPCHVKRDKFPKEYSYNAGYEEPHLKFNYKTKELWFPGAHYDIGRQRFMFYKEPAVFSPDLTFDLKELKINTFLGELTKRFGQNIISFSVPRLLGIPEIHPNDQHSDAVLLWMAGKMGRTDPVAFGSLREKVQHTARARGVRPRRTSRIATWINWLTSKPLPLYSDAYDHLTEDEYLTLSEIVPFAHRFLVGLMDRYLLQDRVIVDPPPPAPSAPPAPPVKFYRAPQSPGVDPDVQLKASEEYRSRSYNSYLLEKRIMMS